MKILIFGLKSAGKTCLIQNVLLGKSWKDLQSIPATEFIDSHEFLYRGILKINIFDLGGQEQFINEYYSDKWVNSIFSNCAAFYFIVDSSNIEQLEKAKSEFYRALKFLREKSGTECKKITLVISKCDICKKTPKEIRKYIFNHPDYSNIITSINVSIPQNTARKNFGKSLNELIPKELKSKQEMLNKLCADFNKKLKSIYSLILNKKDGLEIASSMKRELISTKAKEELEYTSLKVLVHSEEESKIFQLLKDNKIISDNTMNFRLWKTNDNKNIIILQDFTQDTAFFAVFNADNFNYEKTDSALDSFKEKVIKIITK
ncbi:MAG: ADP-ribosylation factor-like protein [Candidatus Helarchaeota archaeon]